MTSSPFGGVDGFSVWGEAPRQLHLWLQRLLGVGQSRSASLMAVTNTDQDLLTRVAIGLTEDGRQAYAMSQLIKYCHQDENPRESKRSTNMTFPISCKPRLFPSSSSSRQLSSGTLFPSCYSSTVAIVSGRPNTGFDLGCHLQIPPSGGDTVSGVAFISLAVAFISLAIAVISLVVAVISFVVDVIPFLCEPRPNRHQDLSGSRFLQ